MVVIVVVVVLVVVVMMMMMMMVVVVVVVVVVMVVVVCYNHNYATHTPGGACRHTEGRASRSGFDSQPASLPHSYYPDIKPQTLASAGWMLGQHLRRWPSIQTALDGFSFPGYYATASSATIWIVRHSRALLLLRLIVIYKHIFENIYLLLYSELGNKLCTLIKNGNYNKLWFPLT